MSEHEHDLEEPVGIDPSESMPTQSKQALMIAKRERLLTYRWPVNMSDPRHVASLRSELGEEAELPTDGGAYYFVYVETGDGVRQPLLIPEGDVRGFVWALALRANRRTAGKLVYRAGSMPV